MSALSTLSTLSTGQLENRICSINLTTTPAAGFTEGPKKNSSESLTLGRHCCPNVLGWEKRIPTQFATPCCNQTLVLDGAKSWHGHKPVALSVAE
jgi:hypothetical protein